MAVTQTDACKTAPSNVCQKDDDGYYYFEIWGGRRLYVGSGTPNAVVTAPLGSVYIETVAAGGTWYVNTDGATAWTAFV